MKQNSNLEVTCILNYTFYHFQIKQVTLTQTQILYT